MTPERIVGIALVRNEDLFVEQAIRNALDFCDELIVCDNGSTDGTLPILERLTAERPDKLRLHRIDHPSESHDLIAGYAGQDVWVFGVDGDELYDPEGLRGFRPRLLGGEFDHVWLLRGNALHCCELDAARTTAQGYFSPPSPSMTKLHNFALIESWDGWHTERLHGTTGLRFKPGAPDTKHGLQTVYSWDESPLRTLHVCFLRRSTKERKAGARRNIPDFYAPRSLPGRVWARLRDRTPFPESSPWKLEHYREGELATVDARPFFQV